jgi:hypothetical protein
MKGMIDIQQKGPAGVADPGWNFGCILRSITVLRRRDLQVLLTAFYTHGVTVTVEVDLAGGVLFGTIIAGGLVAWRAVRIINGGYACGGGVKPVIGEMCLWCSGSCGSDQAQRYGAGCQENMDTFHGSDCFVASKNSRKTFSEITGFTAVPVAAAGAHRPFIMGRCSTGRVSGLLVVCQQVKYKKGTVEKQMPAPGELPQDAAAAAGRAVPPVQPGEQDIAGEKEQQDQRKSQAGGPCFRDGKEDCRQKFGCRQDRPEQAGDADRYRLVHQLAVKLAEHQQFGECRINKQRDQRQAEENWWCGFGWVNPGLHMFFEDKGKPVIQVQTVAKG